MWKCDRRCHGYHSVCRSGALSYRDVPIVVVVFSASPDWSLPSAGVPWPSASA
jgi:hypothetical protein